MGRPSTSRLAFATTGRCTAESRCLVSLTRACKTGRLVYRPSSPILLRVYSAASGNSSCVVASTSMACGNSVSVAHTYRDTSRNWLRARVKGHRTCASRNCVETTQNSPGATLSERSTQLTEAPNDRDFRPYRRPHLNVQIVRMGSENLDNDREVVISTNERRSAEVQ